jgi:putative ABC transport system ATP-binding protein
MLEARHLVVDLRSEEGERRVLDGVDLAVEPGTLVDVSGPSGAGKSTLLMALARIVPRVRGMLALDGRDEGSWDPFEWRTKVALVTQTPKMLEGTVGDNLRFPYGLHVRKGTDPPSDDALRARLDALGLADVSLDREARRLSVGQAARVSLLRTMLTAPEYLLLDEPDANLDDAAAELVEGAICGFADAGGAVVRVRHHRRAGRVDRSLRLEAGSMTEVNAGAG